VTDEVCADVVGVAAYTLAMPSDTRKGLRMSMMKLLFYPIANRSGMILIDIDSIKLP
jgi:hypothetical protein